MRSFAKTLSSGPNKVIETTQHAKPKPSGTHTAWNITTEASELICQIWEKINRCVSRSMEMVDKRKLFLPWMLLAIRSQSI